MSALGSCCCYCCQVASVVSDSVQPHRRQPTRILCPWYSVGKNTGVGCHFLLQGIYFLGLQFSFSFSSYLSYIYGSLLQSGSYFHYFLPQHKTFLGKLLLYNFACHQWPVLVVSYSISILPYFLIYRPLILLKAVMYSAKRQHFQDS